MRGEGGADSRENASMPQNSCGVSMAETALQLDLSELRSAFEHMDDESCTVDKFVELLGAS